MQFVVLCSSCVDKHLPVFSTVIQFWSVSCPSLGYMAFVKLISVYPSANIGHGSQYDSMNQLLLWKCHCLVANLVLLLKSSTPVSSSENVTCDLLITYVQCESKKSPPPEILWHFFPSGWEFLIQVLRAYYMFLSTLDCKILFKYLQLWRSCAILSATTIMCSKCPPSAETHGGIFWHFPQTVRNFRPNFIRLLNVHMYARMQIFIQLGPISNYDEVMPY